MSRIDLFYVFAVLVACGLTSFGAACIHVNAKRSEPQRNAIALLLAGLVFLWFCGFYSGSAYHPCIHPTFTTDGVICEARSK